ncbi:MAG: DEAD/DEAH box helicase [Chloroflexi bacterium]|nr:DEAD/DEAH box helicase [Chloroflexota bacterium]
MPRLTNAVELSSLVDNFCPTVRDWFVERFGSPTDAQAAGWPAIMSGRDTLLAAPTGSGKTLAAFMAGIDRLVRQAEAGSLEAETSIVYVSPLKALSNDIQRNLEEPLEGIRRRAIAEGQEPPPIRTGLRTGDTPANERQQLVRRPPHILITTPESLYLMVTAQRSRETLRRVTTVIVDEIHALARDRRGSHLALTLARLDHIADARPQRVGLSATQRPIEGIARFLTGVDADAAPRACDVVDLGHQRDLELAIEVPPTDLEAVAPGEQWGEIYDRLAELVTAHRTTLIFVNTRKLSERVAHNLAERLGDEAVASHHGSLSKERRHRVEQRLKSGDLTALVATASLELGIDIGSIDLVCQIGSPRSIATFVQRIGRSGHALGLRPHGRLFPTTRDELIEAAALIRAVRAGRLDRIQVPQAPRDVLAQQIVAESASEDWPEHELFDLMRTAEPFAELARDEFDEIAEMLARGIGEGAGRSAPLIHRDRIHGMVRGRRGARLAAITNGGTIPELGDYQVVAEPDDAVVGSVNEDFAMESMAGDIFLLGSTSWRIRRVEQSTVRVVDAQGAPPTIPFWLGEAPGRTRELSQEVGQLRRDIADGLDDPSRLHARLQQECALSPTAAAQMIDYVRATRDGLGLVPSDQDVVYERFFDDSGGMQLVVHAPFGQRVNRAWGLALRKRFCVRFDFELQAAANDDAILLSLGPQHSFPLEETFRYVTSRNLAKSLRQAILYVPLFPTRWRWNVTRALAVPRQRGGKRVPPFLQRLRSDDLLAAVFPDQVGCQENVTGPLEIPDHPLIEQTVRDCLTEAMALPELVGILEHIESGEIRLHARDTVEPSPMAHEIVSGKPYTYLDDAPIEERRTRAVSLRRALPESARDLGQLDADAIARVAEEAWPDPRNAEEVHDALLSLVAVAEPVVGDWLDWLHELRAAGRALSFSVADTDLWAPAEHVQALRLLYPEASVPDVRLPPRAELPVDDRESARQLLLRGHSEVLGPFTADELAGRTGLPADDVARGLVQLEAGGFVLRGHFTPGLGEEEFCDRRLLARMHRATLDRLRRAIDPVSAQDYMRFLVEWQGLEPAGRFEGRAGLRTAIQRLQGFEAPVAAWESVLLPSRVRDFQPSWLDELCLSGEVAWGRLSQPRPNGHAPITGYTLAATRATPITLVPRRDLPLLLAAARGVDVEAALPPTVGAGGEIHRLLESRGALFFDEIAAALRRLPTDVEEGLRALIGGGWVASDGFHGVRALAGRRRRGGWRRRGGRHALGAAASPPGRWSLLAAAPDSEAMADDLAERVAHVMLGRYGVVFRDLRRREPFTLPWRDVLRALRQLEARGAVRGGRFVTGFVGEQYALPEAVTALRRHRSEAANGRRVRISAVDPLNLTGIVTPGERLPAYPGRSIELIDGLPSLEHDAVAR